ncbi:N-6 DNA methylase [Streptomyces sp. M10(2022)]
MAPGAADWWIYGEPPASNANLAWPQYAVRSLNEGGRAAVILPNSAATSSNPKERRIRHTLVDRGVVECVIALPAKLFSATAISVNVWILKAEDQERSPERFCSSTHPASVRRCPGSCPSSIPATPHSSRLLTTPGVRQTETMSSSGTRGFPARLFQRTPSTRPVPRCGLPTTPGPRVGRVQKPKSRQNTTAPC